MAYIGKMWEHSQYALKKGRGKPKKEKDGRLIRWISSKWNSMNL